jgi:hypothetical protein
MDYWNRAQVLVLCSYRIAKSLYGSWMPNGVFEIHAIWGLHCVEMHWNSYWPARPSRLSFLFLEKKTPLTIAVIKSKQLTYLHNKYERYSQIIVMIKRFDIQ